MRPFPLNCRKHQEKILRETAQIHAAEEYKLQEIRIKEEAVRK